MENSCQKHILYPCDGSWLGKSKLYLMKLVCMNSMQKRSTPWCPTEGDGSDRIVAIKEGDFPPRTADTY